MINANRPRVFWVPTGNRVVVAVDRAVDGDVELPAIAMSFTGADGAIGHRASSTVELCPIGALVAERDDAMEEMRHDSAILRAVAARLAGHLGHHIPDDEIEDALRELIADLSARAIEPRAGSGAQAEALRVANELASARAQLDRTATAHGEVLRERDDAVAERDRLHREHDRMRDELVTTVEAMAALRADLNSIREVTDRHRAHPHVPEG